MIHIAGKEVVIMPEKSLKRKMLFSLALLVFSLLLFVFSSYAWFTGKFEDLVNVEVGFVQVDMNVYFDDGVTTYPATEVEIAEGVYKPGIYEVDIASPASFNYFENLRVYIEVSSNVDTYFRIKIYEQLTLTYLNLDDSITELSTLIDGYMPFDYQLTDLEENLIWYDNRIFDDYFYYMDPVIRNSESEPMEIGLITSFSSGSFGTYPIGYSLQIGFSVEAVQALDGPEQVWSLLETPWEISW